MPSSMLVGPQFIASGPDIVAGLPQASMFARILRHLMAPMFDSPDSDSCGDEYGLY
jgi:hypothetical protein